jgi:hypothetical protein
MMAAIENCERPWRRVLSGSPGALCAARNSPDPPRLIQTYSNCASLTVFFRQSHRNHAVEPPVTGLVLLPNTDRGDQLLSYCQEMNDKSQRIAGIFIAPLIMLAGLWLC